MYNPLIPHTLQAVLSTRLETYHRGVEDGTIKPAIYPFCTYGTILLFLFLLIPPSSYLHNRISRYLTLVVILLFNSWVISNCNAYSPGISFCVGVTTAWGSIWAATLLVFKDAKLEFERIEQQFGQSTKKVKQSASHADEKKELRKRNTVSDNGENFISTELDRNESISHVWQPYPTWPMNHRIRWVGDLVGSFRGLDWNWRISGLPSLPQAVQAQLETQSRLGKDIKDNPDSRAGLHRFDTRMSVVKHNLWVLASSYIIIDCLKIIAIHDPYFWGQTGSPAPAYLPVFIQNSAVLLRFYRLAMSQFGVWIALRMVYSLAPLFFAGILGPRYLGVTGEPWLYPDQYGSYMNVFDRGLAGWWGGWWHQMFRYAFEAAGAWATSCLGLDSTSQTTKAAQLFIAFGLSGYIHASASMTSIGPTNPWHPFLFFSLQPVGIIIETIWRKQLKSRGLASQIPKPVAWFTSFMYTHLWFYFTGPLLADDFAKSGVWMSEPLMVSPLRALGFGAEGDGFFCWKGRLASLHRSELFLLSGIAV